MTKQTPPMRIDQRFTCPRICIYTTWSMIWRCIVLAAGVVHVRLISVSRSHELTCITTCHVIATEQTQPYTHTSNYKNRYLVSSYPRFLHSPHSPTHFSYSPSHIEPLLESPIMAPESYVDVLIIGAGPAGLMCAQGLQRAGVNVRIIDKR